MKTQVILGPPGTGKTKSLLDIIDEELSAGIPPQRIAYVTFTRRAAEEAVTRAIEKFNFKRDQLPYFRTLHSLCYRLLNIHSSSVVDMKKLLSFGEWAGVKITGRWNEDGTFSGFEIGDRIMFMENLARVRMIPLRDQYDTDNDDLSWNMVEYTARAYKNWKLENGFVDYTDMLDFFVNSNLSISIDVLANDEAQDQSRLQWSVVEKLARGVRRVAVAGDDDQALYKWAGADVDTFLDLGGDVTKLIESKRVPKNIQTVAEGVISGVSRRYEKNWLPRTSGGIVEKRMDFEEVDCSQGEILILTRNIYLLKEQVMLALKRSGIIYEYNGHSSVSTPILRAIQGWERLRRGEEISVDEARGIYDWMSSGVGVARGYKKLPGFGDDDRVTLKALKDNGGLLRDEIWHEALDRLPAEDVSYILAARKGGEKIASGAPRVRISTIHGSKGGEADHVVLLKEMAARTFREMEFDEDSERRVWYVGATRAREKLTIVEASTSRACPWL